ncbi:MAG TPA: TetR/AcrR family transcriptional regulator [Candidatus Binatia bacterium]|nr:TetR/AcrR family transcriptional regulator [Candidatus Binatia bacterium]
MRAAARSRDDSKRETREALVQAGIAEFAEHGLDTPSLDAICARAGYTRGAFYVHFRDRDAFLVAVMERVLGRFFDSIIATGDAAHDLERTVGRFADALASGRRGASPLPLPGAVQLHRLLEACARSPQIRRRFGSLMQEAIARVGRATAAGQAARTVRGDVDPVQVGLLLVAVAFGGIALLETGIPFDPGKASRTALRLVARRPARA